MTLNELKNDVASLGFESYIENDACFIASANRALSLIYVDRPVSATAIIPIRGPRATFTREFIEHHSGESITIDISGKAISFRSTGTGVCVVRDRTGAAEMLLDTKNQLVKKFVYGDSSITFMGDFYYTVSNFAVFDDMISNKITDIPEYTPFREIRPEDYCEDFRAFCSQPYDKNGNIVDNVKLADGKIIVPHDYCAELHLTYYKSAKPLNSARPDDPIEITEECMPLLPLLTASFMWLDDDAAKAQYYMSLYRDIMANTKRYSTNKIDTAYRVNGWA